VQILEALGNPTTVQIPTIEQLKNMPLLDMVNKESMRSMTTVVSVQRNTTENYTLSNGLTIPKDTNLWVNLWGIHHNDKAFKNPDEFNPYRFENLSSDDSRNFLSFISGARSCNLRLYYYIIKNTN
jgi:cytochrome P450